MANQMALLWIGVSTLAAGLGAAARGATADPALEAWIQTETQQAKKQILAQIAPPSPGGNRPAGNKGSVTASLSINAPDYYYHWVRDAAITMDEMLNLAEREPDNRDRYYGLLKDYADFSRANQQASVGAVADQGEPKFYMNGPLFTGPWGRPQHDGRALRAMTVLRFARALMAAGGPANQQYVDTLYASTLPANTLLKVDLEYTSHRANDPAAKNGYDLWEEVKGNHFFTRMAQWRALVEGAKFANQRGDSGAAAYYAGEAGSLAQEIGKHWDNGRGYIVATLDPDNPARKPSQLDSCVVIAALYANPRGASESLFAPTDDHVLATAVKLSDEFCKDYTINQRRSDAQNRALQPGIGRYSEDTYDGVNTNARGNPWFLATAALAELCYRAASDWTKAGQLTVTPLNQPFLARAIKAEGIYVALNTGEAIGRNDQRFSPIVRAVCELGDGYLRRIRTHCDQQNGSLSEEFNRDTGFMQGAHDPTWSYVAVLRTFHQRESALAAIDTSARPIPAARLSTRSLAAESGFILAHKTLHLTPPIATRIVSRWQRRHRESYFE
jgi:glucoamylase